MANQYTKTVVLKTSAGDVTVTGTKALSIQSYLDNDPRFIHFTNGSNDKQEDYYNLASASCGACLFATVTSGVTTVSDLTCEESLNPCAPEITAITPNSVALAGGEVVLTANNFDESVVVVVNDAVVEATPNVAEGKITFTAPAGTAGKVNVWLLGNGKQSNIVELTYAGE